MTAATREWVTIPVPGKERKQWQVDVTFLMSSWHCIFGQGCQGVLTEPAPELVHGCCDYGAHESEEKVKEKVEKLAKKLGDDEWQFKSVGMKKGVWKKAGNPLNLSFTVSNPPGIWRTNNHAAKIMDPNIRLAWIKSVQTTAFIPPIAVYSVVSKVTKRIPQK